MYTITDVPELAEWMKSKVAAHPSFRPLTQQELDADVAAGLLITSSEEGQKVERNSGQVCWPLMLLQHPVFCRLSSRAFLMLILQSSADSGCGRLLLGFLKRLSTRFSKPAWTARTGVPHCSIYLHEMQSHSKSARGHAVSVVWRL